MNDLVESAINRNYDRILHGERGEQYDGCEDDLREGLRLLAEHGLKYGDSVEKVVSDLNTTDPAAPGMALLYY